MAQKKREVFTRRMLIEHDYRDEAERFMKLGSTEEEIEEYVAGLFKEKYIADPEDEGEMDIEFLYFENLTEEISYLQEGIKRKPEPEQNYKEYHKFWIMGYVHYYPVQKKDNISGKSIVGWYEASTPEEAIKICIGELALEASKNKKHNTYISVSDFKCVGWC